MDASQRGAVEREADVTRLAVDVSVPVEVGVKLEQHRVPLDVVHVPLVLTAR